jgi:TP901 family phage tail tape measure protein
MARTHESRLIVSLLDRVSAPARKVSGALRNMGTEMGRVGRGAPGIGTRLEASMARTNAAVERARGGIIDAVGAYYTLRAAIGAPVQAAREFESAMADVRKVVDFPTPEAFQEFQRGLLELSKRVPITVNGLAEIAAAAGQAGIAGEELNRFTETAAKVGTAFDISADQAGESLAKMMTGLDLNLEQVTLLSDAMNHLSNSQASSAPEILDFTRRVGAQAKQYGFAATEAAAFGSAMIASGAQAEVASTSFMNMGRALTRGESATKRQNGALSQLGLNASDVARRMQEDAVGTTIDVMERIAALPREVQAAVSSDLFGDEARALGPLLTNLDLVRSSIGLVANEADYAGSAFREFEVRAGTFDNKVRRFNNVMTALKVTIGSALIPVLSDLMDAVAPVVESMARFVEAHPQMAGKLMASVGAVVAFKGALAGLRFAGLLGQSGALSLAHLGLVKIGGTAARVAGAARASIALQAALAGMSGASVTRLDRIKAGLGGIARATPGLRTATPVVGAVFGVIGAISAPAWAAIAAAVAAVGLAWRKWDRVKAILSGIGQAVGEAIAPAMERLGPMLEPLAPVLERAARGFKAVDDAIRGAAEFARSLTDGLFSKELLSDGEVQAIKKRAYDLTKGIIDEIKKLPSLIREQAGEMIAAGQEFMDGLVDTALARLQRLVDRVRALGANIRSALTPGEGSPEGAGVPGRQAPIGARARGGRISSGGTYVVGEEGIEVITPQKSGYVHSSGSGGGLSIGSVNINPSMSFPGATAADADRIAGEVMRRIRNEAGSAMRAAFADIGLE